MADLLLEMNSLVQQQLPTQLTVRRARARRTVHTPVTIKGLLGLGPHNKSH
jgi:hypothetical protein